MVAIAGNALDKLIHIKISPEVWDVNDKLMLCPLTFWIANVEKHVQKFIDPVNGDLDVSHSIEQSPTVDLMT